MVDCSGYLRLIDFGFAKRLDPHERTFSICGTLNYCAPEVVLDKVCECGWGKEPWLKVAFWTLVAALCVLHA